MIVPIVEGESEVISVPVLIRRILSERFSVHQNVVARPIRKHRNKIIQVGELERYIDLAQTRRTGTRAILITLDADDDCPAELSAELLGRAKAQASHLVHSVVIAKMEFEAWFLGALESLRGSCGLGDNIQNHSDPESVRGAKEALSSLMVEGTHYLSIQDQVRMASQFDLNMAQANCPSFDKLVRDIESLVNQLKP